MLYAYPPAFPATAAGAVSAPVPVPVTNDGDAPLTITNVQVQAEAADGGNQTRDDFQIVGHDCAAATPLPPGGTCTVNVAFRPSRTNYTSVARLQFTSTSDDAMDRVLLAAKSTGDAFATVGGNVPSLLQLAVVQSGGSFGTFVPGVNATYNTALAATAITTTADAALSVADMTGNQVGNLVNGSFALTNPLGVRALGLGDDPATAFSTVSGTPTTLKTWNTPVTGAPLTLGFRQQITNTEALRAGTYNKTLTFTLSTTTP